MADAEAIIEALKANPTLLSRVLSMKSSRSDSVAKHEVKKVSPIEQLSG